MSATLRAWINRVRVDGHGQDVRAPTRTLGLLAFSLLARFTKVVNPFYSLGSLSSTATSVLPLARRSRAGDIVISGGIDLSISAQMALTCASPRR
jgi:ribose/xylose/arabinose/galactoside ABC-type transport system permease subunit